MRAFYALFVARNKEFLRDRATLAWNFLFPFVAVGALAVVFSGEGRELYKVGVLTERTLALGAAAEPASNGDRAAALSDDPAVQAFLRTRYVQFVPVADLAQAQDRVRHHQFDLVVDGSSARRYWVNPSNPKGYFLERALWSADGAGGTGSADGAGGTGSADGAAGTGGAFQREALEGREIRYIDWLLPGVLAMNMMFSCLWGVGYVIVRYRKGLILRRLKATPITAFQFICAQIASRLVLVLFTTAVLFFGLDLMLDFYRAGSLIDLFLVFALGGACLIALGIFASSRTSSQELAGGLLNLATWPMMFLSGVWFSLEGSDRWLILFAKTLPLTHLIDAARKIMVDGATLAGVLPELGWLTGMTAAFLAGAALLFRWE